MPRNVAAPTTFRSLLFATQGFADLNVVTPDYIITSNFFSLVADPISYTPLHTVTFTAGQLPTDGINALGSVVETRVRPNCLAVLSNLPQRYVACGDGTVIDLHTGLIWLADASCKELAGTDTTGQTEWPGAMAAAAALSDGTCGLSDGSQPGDWRLATAEEWEETMERAFMLVCLHPALTNAPGDDCHDVGPTLFIGVEDFYWTRDGESPDKAWLALANLGITFPDFKSNDNHVWPVRDRR